MYVTILTGRVSHENWIPLTHIFERVVTKNSPAGLLKSCLVQSEDEPLRWRIISLWSDKTSYIEYAALTHRAGYEELMCDSGTTPYRHGYESKGWYERV